MPSYRKYQGPGGKMVAYFKRKGTIFSKVVNSKKEGKKWRREKERELETMEIQIKNLMFSEIASDYLMDCDARWKPNTVAEKDRHLQKLAEWLKNDIPAHQITLDVARAFIGEVQAEKKNKGANRYLRNLKACWNWNKNRLMQNPWSSIKSYAEDEPKKYVPPSKDIKAVLGKGKEIEKVFIEVILKTAARRGEVLKLEWIDLDFENKQIRLSTRKRSDGNLEYDFVPMSHKLSKVLKSYKSKHPHTEYVFTDPKTGKKYDKNQVFIKSMLKKLCEKAGVKPFGFHSLRHYVAHKAWKSGKATLLDIQKLLRHKKLTTTIIYLESLNITVREIGHLGPILDED